jgi:hypothetical protein
MTGAPDHHDATPESRPSGQESMQYPTNHLLAIIDDQGQATAAVAALEGGGFLDSEVQLNTGAETADVLGATSGRGGLAGLLIRLAERIGAADEEMETKHRYEQAMRDNRFVVAIAAPTEERKHRATEILRAHGAHTIAFLGKHTIEYVTAPNRR